MGKNRSARHYTDNYYQAVANQARAARRQRCKTCTLARCTTGDTTTQVTDRTSGNSAGVKTLHGAHPLRALHPLRHLHPSDCLHHGHDIGTQIPIESLYGKRPEPQRQGTRPASTVAIARYDVNRASRSTARQCSAAATLSARTGS